MKQNRTKTLLTILALVSVVFVIDKFVCPLREIFSPSDSAWTVQAAIQPKAMYPPVAKAKPAPVKTAAKTTTTLTASKQTKAAAPAKKATVTNTKKKALTKTKK